MRGRFSAETLGCLPPETSFFSVLQELKIYSSCSGIYRPSYVVERVHRDSSFSYFHLVAIRELPNGIFSHVEMLQCLSSEYIACVLGNCGYCTIQLAVSTTPCVPAASVSAYCCTVVTVCRWIAGLGLEADDEEDRTEMMIRLKRQSALRLGFVSAVGSNEVGSTRVYMMSCFKRKVVSRVGVIDFLHSLHFFIV